LRLKKWVDRVGVFGFGSIAAAARPLAAVGVSGGDAGLAVAVFAACERAD
jgi:hypothetical protein